MGNFPSKFDPEWTESMFTQGGARDALGLEALGQTILDDLLPGINNQTRRARYYSFWAWVLRDFILDSNTTHTQTGFYEWLHKRENTLILANLSHGCEGRAQGVDQGRKYWQDGELESYSLNWKSLLSVDGGGYELYYKGVLQEMNIIKQSENSPHDDLTNSVGVGLAGAYGKSVSKSNYVQRYLDASRLRKEEIIDFANYGCLCQLSNNEIERKRLIDAFFRFDTPDAYAVRRLSTLCFFLDIISQSKGQSLTNSDFRSAMYFWSYSSSHAYQPEGNFINPAKHWRIFQLRQYYVFIIESFWSLFLDRVYGNLLSGDEYIDWLLSELDLKILGKDFKIKFSSFDPYHLTLNAFIKDITLSLSDESFMPGPLAFDTQLNEKILIAPIWRNHSLNVAVRAGNALLTLMLMYLRCSSWREGDGWHMVSQPYASGRLPIENYMQHVDTAIHEDWTLAKWLAWFHHKYLWLQHRWVTLGKLYSRDRSNYSSQETEKFEVINNFSNDDVHYRNSGRPRFRGIGTDLPKMNGPRFPSALNIFLDLDIIKKIENNSFQLQPDGKNLLDKFRTYTIPDIEERLDEVTEDHK